MTILTDNGKIYYNESSLIIQCAISEIGIIGSVGLQKSIDNYSFTDMLHVFASSCDLGVNKVNGTVKCNIIQREYTVEIPLGNNVKNGQWWRCIGAVNGKPHYSLSAQVLTVVPVKTITITPAVTNDQLNGVEGQTQTFTCTTSPCRPAAWIQWYIGYQNLTTQSAIHISKQAGNTLISSSTLKYTWMSADNNKSMYCEAINFKEAQTVTSAKILIYIHNEGDFTLTGSDNFIISNQPLTLNCSSHIAPRGEAAYFYKDNISTINIRYLPSTSTCYGIPQDSTPVFICNDTCSCSEDAGIFTWTYSGTVINQRMTFKSGMDFGTDKSNITYRELTVERSLYPPTSNTPNIQKPDPPTNVSAVCKETSMTVFWRPGFNGGYTQLFKVVILNNQTNQTTSSSFISDQGETEIMKVVFDSLSSKTLYIVSMQAINKLGTVEYDGEVHCTTISAPKSGQSDMISAAGIGAGIGSAVIILVLTRLVVFFYKKRINENKEPNSMYQATENSSEDVVNAEKHIYNELQHVGNDSSVMDHISDETSTYYNECGTMTNIEHYQNINRHNEAADCQDENPPVYIELNIFDIF